MGLIPYSHDESKMPFGGMNLNLPPDLIPKGQYSRFVNAVSQVEGRVEGRDGISALCSVGTAPVHTIFRLNQPSKGILGERLFGIGSQLWSAPLPAGNVPVQLATQNFDGTPLSIMSFRFDNDTATWAIIANGGAMMKRRAGYYQPLGVSPPTVGPSATVGGAGALNGSYDWLYTYVHPVTLSESNPSPFMGAPPSPPAMSIFTTPFNGGPVGGFFNTAYSNPGSAIDGNQGTFAQGNSNAVGNSASCTWRGASGNFGPIVLNVLHSGTLTGTASNILIYYSLDGGSTWNLLFSDQTFTGGTSYGQRTDSVTLPAGQDMTKVIVYAAAFVNNNPGTAIHNVYEIYFTNPAGSGTQLPLGNQVGRVCVAAPPVGSQGTTIRLYRRGGALNDAYRLVGSFAVSSLSQGVCGAGSLEIDDNTSDANLASAVQLNFDNNVPVSSVQINGQPLKAIWGFDERVLGCGDPARPEAIYFSKVGNADEWPPQNFIEVLESGSEAMNGVSWNLRCWVFTRSRLYMLIDNLFGGTTYSVDETPCRRGLKGRFGLCSGEKGIYFVANDGVFLTNGGVEQSIIDDAMKPLFPVREGRTGVAVGQFDAVDMTKENSLRLEYHNGEIWFFYAGLNTQTQQLLIYDERRNRWRSGQYTPQIQMVYTEPDDAGVTTSLLFGGTDGKVYQGGILGGDDNGTPISVEIRTGASDQGRPLNLKEYGSVMVDIDPGGATVASPVTITPYINGEAIVEAAVTATGSGRQRVPIEIEDALENEVFGLNLSLDFSWSSSVANGVRPIIYQTDTLYRFEPAAFQHWELPPHSFEMPAWWHVRGCYFTLRSNSAVTFTFTPDTGPAQSFVIASTGGSKQKIYIPLAANKQKLAQLELDSTADFRVYWQESHIRAKPWIAKSGYKEVAIFGAEQPTSG